MRRVVMMLMVAAIVAGTMAGAATPVFGQVRGLVGPLVNSLPVVGSTLGPIVSSLPLP